MSPPPRSLSFAVSTSLLTASLSLGASGCDDKGPTSNPAPEKPQPERTINEGPVEQPTTAAPQPEPQPEPAPEPVHVNEGPEPSPEPPQPEQPDPALEPKNVNTRPDIEIPK